jgi:ketosteroid isomerase-like protein
LFTFETGFWDGIKNKQQRTISIKKLLNMKTQSFVMLLGVCFSILLFACNSNKSKNPDELKQEIIQVEKDFETTVQEKGIAEAFYFYADQNAVIRRVNDTLIKGKDNIRKFYERINFKNTVLNWVPDFVEVSKDGSLGYTYGTFIWKEKDADGKTTTTKGVFHTVWKKQKNGTWKYVWD